MTATTPDEPTVDSPAGATEAVPPPRAPAVPTPPPGYAPTAVPENRVGSSPPAVPGSPSAGNPPPGYAPVGHASPVVAPAPPNVTATILITFFFGLFGLIPAIRGARRARAAGYPENRYWIAFGATMAGSLVAYVLVVVALFAALIGAVDHAATTDAASGALASGQPATSAPAARLTDPAVQSMAARVQSIAAAHAPALAVLSAIDPDTSHALSANPNDTAALGRALSEVAKQQGASAAEQQQVADAVTQRAPQLTAVQAIPVQTLATLQTNPTDAAAGAAAIQGIMQQMNLSQAQAIALLQSLASPQVQSDLQLVNKYATVLKQAQADIPPDDLAYLQAHASQVQAASAAIATK